MKVIVDLQLYDQDLGGGKTFVDALLPRLVYDNKDIQFLLIGPSSIINLFPNSLDNVRIFLRTPPRSHWFRVLVSLYVSFLSLIYRDHILWGPLNYVGLLPNSFKKTVVTIHDVMCLDRPEYFSRLGLFFRRLQLLSALKFATDVVSVSHFTMSRVKHYSRSFSCRFHVSYEALYLPAEPIKGPSPVENSFLLFVGVGRENKNLKFLVKSFDELVEEYGYEGNLVIAGKISESDREVLKLETKFPSKLLFPGFIREEDLGLYYENTDAFVFPSTYEGFGLPPMEALYYGARLVLSDIPVFKELYSSVAVLSEVSDPKIFATAILRCLQMPNRDLRADFWEKFSWKSSSELYSSIIGE